MAAVFKARRNPAPDKPDDPRHGASKVQATVAPMYWAQEDFVLRRYDPDYKECLSAETLTEVERKFHTPSPDMVSENEKDDVSVLGLENNTAEEQL